MEKKHIIKFLQQRKKGVYNLIVQLYANVITSMGPTMAMDIVKDDLEKEAGTPVEIHYFALAQAILRYKKKNPKVSSGSLEGGQRFSFKDAYELNDVQLVPGRFKRDKIGSSISKNAKSKSK
ncbi:hypothetical protein [Chryseolinea lacunae]|uniref:Uncharacterized protein n=1 Tax=Chryseolinea lacunae TaxID=2801331 RepID=A0ABS1KRX7_9BACT|nr:hypothetical protein [Chryseolinea lacunae]MBL0742100.1 hypothetical protein [Chryseolinea lacunae]